jgi:hypothetical protein
MRFGDLGVVEIKEPGSKTPVVVSRYDIRFSLFTSASAGWKDVTAIVTVNKEQQFTSQYCWLSFQV